MVKVSSSVTLSDTTEKDLFSISTTENYIAFLKRLTITNNSTALATITFKAYNGSASKTILVVNVDTNKTQTFREDELPAEGIPTKLTATTTSAPVVISFTYDLV
jgi:hypothetical protein